MLSKVKIFKIEKKCHNSVFLYSAYMNLSSSTALQDELQKVSFDNIYIKIFGTLSFIGLRESREHAQ